MSSRQMPPWLQEQIMKMQQSQQNLQSVMTQRQHIEMEKAETTKALEELKRASDDDAVFKHVGTVMIKSTRKDLIDDLEERQTMASTRMIVLEKQETRLKESLKEQEANITKMMKGGPAAAAAASAPSDDSRR